MLGAVHDVLRGTLGYIDCGNGDALPNSLEKVVFGTQLTKISDMAEFANLPLCDKTFPVRSKFALIFPFLSFTSNVSIFKQYVCACS